MIGFSFVAVRVESSVVGDTHKGNTGDAPQGFRLPDQKKSALSHNKILGCLAALKRYGFRHRDIQPVAFR